MTFLKLSMTALAAATLLAQPAAAGNQGQGQGHGKPECPGAPGAVPTGVGAAPAPQGTGSPVAVAPAFDECGVGAFPQAESDGETPGKGKSRR